ncbi:tyrosine-type recombinase/integrase [Halorhodospira neutriphila]|uniref:Phage integrase family protein n=1 Tax=Halorhodospira neutriphila TaxID=168379 RepID=A0ABS1E4X2_9GAMM|nr:integrase family protein [Halorhodospira neutriphila]MBK1726801.1 hypothetical protein [Halorhodospira neutriphila]
MAEHLKFTKTTLERIEPPAKGRATYHDTDTPGLSLRVTDSGAKSFCIQRRVNGRVKRVTIGRFPDWTVQQARKRAKTLLANMVEGTDPVAAKKAEQARKVTLAEVFEEYLATRKTLKRKTVKDYRRVMDEAVPDWKGKPVAEITKDDVAQRHAHLGENHGPAWANLSMRTLRALFNFAKKYEDEQGRSILPENPVERLSQTRAWYKVDRRRNLIKRHQLPDWFDAVEALDNPVARDYLLFLLFTGMRRSEAARLRWSEVDFKGQTFTVYDTKNSEPLELPLSAPLVEILERRREAAGDHTYVFPARTGDGPIQEPKKAIEKVRKASGTEFSCHDLRRTFSTVAESVDVPHYALKRLLNHKTNSADVTGGYIVLDVERLREPMERIADYLLKAGGHKEGAEVFPIEKGVQEGGGLS